MGNAGKDCSNARWYLGVLSLAAARVGSYKARAFLASRSVISTAIKTA
jgi:hypothetical protein